MAIPCDVALRLRLIAVAQELQAPDLLIRGGRVWNAFTGETIVADIAVCADRIAKVGVWSGPLTDSTRIVDAADRIAVPGYIEPHTHPWPFCNPLSLGEAAVCRGTTCLVYDDLFLHLAMDAERLGALTSALSGASLPHIFWLPRVASQSRFRDEAEVFSRSVMNTLLRPPHVLGTGEMTRWSDLLDPERSPRLLAIFEDARCMGKFNDGHTAGASSRRLAALATAGIHSCHEATTADEALERLRQGFWVLLRNSSLREDLSELLACTKVSAFSDRLAYTTDGAAEYHVAEKGFIDHLIHLSLEAGLAPNLAYRMATLNPANYLGMGEDLGAVAPGRVADINILSDFNHPTPDLVICRGRLAASDGTLEVPAPSASFAWDRYGTGIVHVIPAWPPDVFLLPATAPNPFPSGRLANAVITREVPVELAPRGRGLWPRGKDTLVLAASDRKGRWISRGVIQNLAPNLEGLATTYTTNAGVLVLGRSPEAMAEALARLKRLGGGIVVSAVSGEWAEFPMPMAGVHGTGGFAEATEAARQFRRTMDACGYHHADPKYTMLFSTCDVLPDVRATEAGWVRIKTNEVLLASEWMTDAAGQSPKLGLSPPPSSAMDAPSPIRR